MKISNFPAMRDPAPRDKFKISNLKFQKNGMIITYVLVFGGVFLMLLGALFGFILLQLKQSAQRVAYNEALNIAEAGVDYYRWCVNNGVEANCQGERDYYDGSGVLVGKFSVAANVSTACGQTSQRQIISTGWTGQFPLVKRNVKVVYGRESIAKYSYILNSSVWIGNDHQIQGPYHSNGGIRMDGRNDSLMTSAAIRDGLGEWVCTGSFGCSPCPTGAGRCRVSGDDCVCPGIFTTTANPTTSLFKFPVPPFDFNAITMDLAQIKDKAQNGGGLYFPESVNLVQGSKGYHLNFKNNGTVEVWAVMALQQTYGYSEEDGWHQDRFTINNEALYGTYPIPADCSVIYVEDDFWVTGTVKGKVVAASANLVDAGVDTDIILTGNITYSTYGGADGLALIAEKNVLIGPESPDDMELHAIIVAQKGRFGRNHYPDNFKNTLSIYGSVVSSGRVGTQWTSGGQMVSGYAQRYTYFDQSQVYSPPPFVAHMGSDLKIVSWEEME